MTERDWLDEIEREFVDESSMFSYQTFAKPMLRLIAEARRLRWFEENFRCEDKLECECHVCRGGYDYREDAEPGTIIHKPDCEYIAHRGAVVK